MKLPSVTTLITILSAILVGACNVINKEYDLRQHQEDISLEKLPHCDHNIINDRRVSQR
jgi:hypothetical protein